MLTLLLMVLLPVVLAGIRWTDGHYLRRRAYFCPAARLSFPPAPWELA